MRLGYSDNDENGGMHWLSRREEELKAYRRSVRRRRQAEAFANASAWILTLGLTTSMAWLPWVVC